MIKLRIFLLSALCAAFTPAARAQIEAPPPDIVRYSGEYMLRTGPVAALFNGRIQEPLIGNIESMYLRDRNKIERDMYGVESFPRPVSLVDSYSVGDIFYDGVYYRGVTMRLDLYRDQLAVTASGGVPLPGIVIDHSRLGYADLRGYRVIHIPNPVSDDFMRSGYYLLLNEERHRVVKKERFELDNTYLEFSIRTIRYYIEKDGVFHNVGRRRGPVLRLFREHRAELRRHIRAYSLNLRHDTERALVEIVDEYERLTDR
jgi:hypothetical protein